MIEFIYKPNPDMMQLIVEDTVDHPSEDFIYGILEEESIYQLKKLQLFLVCEIRSTKDSKKITYANPLAVVALNDHEAIKIYYSFTELNASVMCTLAQDASKIKVEPIQ